MSNRRSPSRRDFLKGVGAAGAGLVAGSLGGAATAAPAPSPLSPRRYASVGGAPATSVDFGRIFPDLPPFADATDTVRAALLEVGQQRGIDAQDDLAAGPKALIVDPTVNGNPTAANPYGTNPDNPTMTAGSTFVGQFTDHDITFDQTSQLGVPQNPLISTNTRTPALGPSDLSDIAAIYAPFAASTPLWYYILAEPKATEGGLNLGPVGGRIVTETLIGLLRADPTSYLSLYPRFQAFLGTDLQLGPTPNPNIAGNRSYTRAHFLYYAGVVTPGIYR